MMRNLFHSASVKGNDEWLSTRGVVSPILYVNWKGCPISCVQAFMCNHSYINSITPQLEYGEWVFLCSCKHAKCQQKSRNFPSVYFSSFFPRNHTESIGRKAVALVTLISCPCCWLMLVSGFLYVPTSKTRLSLSDILLYAWYHLFLVLQILYLLR